LINIYSAHEVLCRVQCHVSLIGRPIIWGIKLGINSILDFTLYVDCVHTTSRDPLVLTRRSLCTQQWSPEGRGVARALLLPPPPLIGTQQAGTVVEQHYMYTYNSGFVEQSHAIIPCSYAMPQSRLPRNGAVVP